MNWFQAYTSLDKTALAFFPARGYKAEDQWAGHGVTDHGWVEGLKSRKAQMPLREISFLVIEDHPFQRNMLRQMLIGMGAATVHSAENGKEALRLLRDPTVLVDIVISDLAMPEMDGIELLAHLHEAREGVSLIFLSASQSNLQAAVDIAEAGGVQVLGAIAKPVSAENIAPLVALYLARRQGRNE